MLCIFRGLNNSYESTIETNIFFLDSVNGYFFENVFKVRTVIIIFFHEGSFILEDVRQDSKSHTSDQEDAGER